jgi:hypothetical protein
LTPDAALKTAGAVELESAVYPLSAPYLMYTGLNLLVCDLGSALDAGTWVVPVTREIIPGESGNYGGDNLLATWPAEEPTGKTSHWGSLHAFMSLVDSTATDDA